MGIRLVLLGFIILDLPRPPLGKGKGMGSDGVRDGGFTVGQGWMSFWLGPAHENRLGRRGWWSVWCMYKTQQQCWS